MISMRKTFLIVLFLIMAEHVGCDGIVGSKKTADRCGVCGGDNMSCRIISGILTRTKLPQGYFTITQIPKGACNINITELRKSGNYIALKKLDGSYILNGNWKISPTGKYESVGTVFDYHRKRGRKCRGECIRAKGPINEPVKLQILYYRRNPGIIYQYTVPVDIMKKVMKTIDSAKNTSSRTLSQRHHRHHHQQRRHLHRHQQSLHLGSEGIPNNKRRQQVLQQPIIVSNKDRINPSNKSINYGQPPEYIPPYDSFQQQRLGNHEYRPAQAPDDSVSNYHVDSSPTRFQSQSARGAYNRRYIDQASQQIGSVAPLEKINKSSQLQANLLVNPGNAKVTGNRKVSPSRRHGRPFINDAFPPEQPLYEWRISGFTECSETCGRGIQETRIICMKKNSQLVVTDDNCDLMEKPTPQVISCNIEPCPVQWVVGNWSACSVTCGEGIQTRSAECKKRISPSYYLWVSATACLFSPRPPTTKKCKNKPCAEWRIGEWGKCSAECGHGQRTREVRCVNVEDVEISDTHCTETRPATEEICDMGSCAKAWFYTSWSKECSTPCGKGVLTRKVFCSADDGTSLPDSRCNTSEKPHTEKSCKNTQPCGGMWFTGNWSPCTATCSNGFRIRDVACVKRLGSGLYTVVTEENCLSTSKPSGKEPCATLPSCPPDWYLTEWAECSASCGTGYRSREVKCMDENLEFSALCSNEKKPITRQTCNSYSCHRPQLDSDPGCKDKLGYCKLVVQARLCPYKYYKERCCESCKDYS